ncbi:arginine repressor [Streptococcus sp. DD13]|uniref:arginine repressor n=1 Tax=Streptococcus sp. DD13 TaxID=1777881 RepID=UPI0007930BEF|nr:arginine repressor [Streptococcus sp. DD13]KXT79250.1 Arginine pathway regulatory protein ArgR, repressor of arg regulon [Streptococcus sp. DD13]
MHKRQRLALIKDIVVRYQIDTQDEIVERLKEAGVEATQATVSRDVKELGIVKVPVGKGYCYSLPKSNKNKIKASTVRDVRSLNNMIHIDAVPGTTFVLKKQILEHFDPFLFSVISDDDSILVVTRDPGYVPQIIQTIQTW